MPKFSDIPRFPHASYSVEYSLCYLPQALKDFEEEMGLDMDPDFQRGHVWTKEQQTAFMEFMFRGGIVNNNIYFNCPKFNSCEWPKKNFVLVDGKQRLKAVIDFLDNKVPVFGYFCNEYEDFVNRIEMRFRIHVAELETQKEVLEWYLSMNAGGTPHSEEELNRIRDLLKKEEK